MLYNVHRLKFMISVFSLGIVACMLMGRSGLCATEKNISELWAIQHRALQGSRFSTSEYESAKAAIYDYMLDSGIRRASFIAAAYCAEGAEMVKQDKVRTAVWCFQTALDFDPAYMPAAKGLLAASLDESPVAFLFSIPTAVRTLVFSFTDIRNLFAFTGNLAVYIGFWVFLILTVYSLSLLIQKSPLIANDLSERFMRHISEKMAWPVLVFLVALPLILGRGLVWTLLWIVFIVFLYAGKKETIVLGILFSLLFLVLPAGIVKTMVFKGHENVLFQT